MTRVVREVTPPRQYARLVQEWVASIGLDPAKFGTHSLRRTKVVLVSTCARGMLRPWHDRYWEWTCENAADGWAGHQPCAERMLNRPASYRHSLWQGFQPVSRCIDDALMLPSSYATLFAWRAAWLQFAAGTVARPVKTKRLIVLRVCHSEWAQFAGRIAIRLLLTVIFEISLVEPAFGSRIRCPRLWHIRLHADLLTREKLLTAAE